MSKTAVETMSLNGKWLLTRRSSRKNADYAKRPRKGAIEAQVPGDVHLDLMRAGEIQDPLLRDNAKKCAWIGKQEWWHSKTFKAKLPEGARHELVFDGLCYVADVWLNGTHVAHHLTMHRPLRVDVAKTLKPRGENLLVVRLLAFDDDALEIPEIGMNSKWSDGIADKRHCMKRSATHKALYSLGWDWTQGLSICGIWRDVRIESTPLARIDNVFVKAALNGALSVSFESFSNLKEIRQAKAKLSVREKASKKLCATSELALLLGPGVETYELSAKIESPKLWRPVGTGEAFLYEAEIELTSGDELADRKTSSFGIRSVEIAESKIDEKQGTFKFIVNGEPVFIKGANWVPPDIIPARATEETYRVLLKQVVECGMNYLRFWGGGIYESQLFYDLCDELGIMVWQEMMFSCPEFPDFDPAFVEESRKEAEHVVKAYRNHPSIIVWCGSNETDTLQMDKGLKSRPNGKYYGHRILHKLLPETIKPLDPTRAYIPSCPALGKFSPPGNHPRDFSFGTSHGNFAHAFATDEELDAGKLPAFLNECYANSPDPESSVEKYLSEKDLGSWSDPVFDAHNIMNVQYSCERTLFSDQLYFHTPGRFLDIPMKEKFAAFHENHCELIKRYTEFLRRKKELCGGVAFWMFNSAFTMMDWSVVDYYLLPKPAFFAAKRANVPILPVPAVYPDRVDFHVVSDSLEPIEGELVCEIRKFTGETLAREAKAVKIEANASKLHLSIDRKRLGETSPAACFAQATLTLPSGERAVNHRFLSKIRELELPVAEIEVKAVEGKRGSFRLRSEIFARNVELLPFNDENLPNDDHFDLLPGVEKIVSFKKPLPLEAVKLKWRNDKKREFVLTGLEKDAVSGEWKVSVFNATKESKKFKLEVKCDSFMSIEEPEEVEIAPLGSAKIELSPSFDITKFKDGKSSARVSLKAGADEVLQSELARSPFSFENGTLRIENRSARAIKSGKLNIRFLRAGGEKATLETPPLEISPKSSFVHDFKIPADALPNSFSLWRGAVKLCKFWGFAKASAEDVFKSFPTVEFDGGPIKSFKARGEMPDLKREGHGYLVSAKREGNGVERFGEKGGSFVFFLHHKPDALFFDILIKDIPHRQRYFGESVYQDSCVELVFGDVENKQHLDCSMALTQLGPELFLRRGHSGFKHGEVKNPELAMQVSPKDGLICCSCRLDLKKLGMPRLFNKKAFKLSLVVRGKDQSRIALFNGVVCGSGVAQAGLVSLQEK